MAATLNETNVRIAAQYFVTGGLTAIALYAVINMTPVKEFAPDGYALHFFVGGVAGTIGPLVATLAGLSGIGVM